MKSQTTVSTKKTNSTSNRQNFRRALMMESLESRRLMTGNNPQPDANGFYYPPVGIRTADFTESVPQDEYIRRSIAQYGSGAGQGLSGNGEPPPAPPAVINELEPNNQPRFAQLLPLGSSGGKSVQVTVNGFTQGLSTGFDEDYFAVDLRAGDFFDVQLNAAVGTVWDVSLTDASMGTIVGRNSSQAGYGSTNSPISTAGVASFTYVVPSDGRYYLRISDGIGAYSAVTKVFRSTYEAETIGTKQIVFVDFDGATLRRDIFGVPGTARLSGIGTFMDDFGLLPSDENALIDSILNTIYENYFGTIPSKAGNGWYMQDGIAGNFDVEFRNSRDHADPWGLPNVSRIIIGGTFNEFLIQTRGIAQSVDIGNFNRTETAVVLPEAYVLEDAINIPRVGSRTAIDVLGVAIGNTASHELGHFFGAVHQDNSNTTLSLMDSGGLDLGLTRVGIGPDGIYGTPDDVDIDFGVDEYAPVEGWFGREDTAAVIAWGLATGTTGATITGRQWNDRNRDGQINTGEEGLFGWTVYADLNNNSRLDGGEPRVNTDASGNYSIAVAPGTITLRTIPATNWQATNPSTGIRTVTVTNNQTLTGQNFGFILPTPVATGFKWNDLDGDGLRETGEPPLAGIWIYLDLDGDDRIDIGEPADITKADGSYRLTPPRPGTYAIREVLDPGFLQTYPVGGEHIVNFDGINSLRGYDFGNRFALDFGDAPAPYPTTLAQNGATAGFITGFSLGANIDIENDGQPNATATGDDIAGLTNASLTVIDDEDGIALLQPIVRGSSTNKINANLVNTTGQNAYLHGWIDLNQDGDWSDAGEKIISNRLLTVGNNEVSFAIPSTALLGNTFARFRLSQEQNIAATGRSQAGEVEDYRFEVVNSLELAVDDNFSVARNSVNNTLDVLANDFKLTGETLRIVANSNGSQGGTVRINSAGTAIQYTPRNGFVGRETFTYRMQNSRNEFDEATVTVDVTLRFNDPVAVDDIFNVTTNSVGIPLNVLANDIEGLGGALQIISVTTPDQGGTVVIGSGNQSLRYTPRRNYEGTETFSYTASDSDGKTTTAKVTIQMLPGANDDVVEISFAFRDAAGQLLSDPRVAQGSQFKVDVLVDDLRSGASLGVFAAYLDLLYNASLVTPSPNTTSGSSFNFKVDFGTLYQNGQQGTNEVPGLIDDLGAFTNAASMNQPNAVVLATLTFDALAPGLVDFAADPADDSPFH